MGGGQQLNPPSEARIVGERAQARWRSLIAKDLDNAYTYLSPGSRSIMTLQDYKNRHRVGFYRDIELESTKCDGAVCTVRLVLTYDAKGIQGIRTPITEKWVLEDGTAWFVEQR
jgi:hypothetical protein